MDERVGDRRLRMPFARTIKIDPNQDALALIDEYGVRATARILDLPRRTLQRWCRAEGMAAARCPEWVYSWAAKRRKRRRFWAREGYG